MTIDKEPVIRVGLMTGASAVKFALAGHFVDADGASVKEGAYTASSENGVVRLEGDTAIASPAITLCPADFHSCSFTVDGVRIGIDFHWEREESQKFQGTLKFVGDGDELTLINELPLESYLVSVISSEMNASCPAELLRAHAIISRSWLAARFITTDRANLSPKESPSTTRAEHSSAVDETTHEIIRWYGRESHVDFDVCADDHCQRYQGVSKASSGAALDAVRGTRGKVLVYGDVICDTRYSKCCGGMTETYSTAWEDEDVPYLKPVYDGPGSGAPGYRLPLSVEANAEDWIAESPLAYCGMAASELLTLILPGVDQETRNFYRWRVDYSQDELSAILNFRLGVDLGRVRALVPLERGESGRIVKLRIVGENRTLVIGKELEIRRVLSRSHLYSSAFVVRAAQARRSDYPARFKLIGAGWGHGVGVCQIGAAVMADRGHSHEEVLAHYFHGATIKNLY